MRSKIKNIATHRLMKKIITLVFVLIITKSFGQNFWRNVNENQIPNSREIDRGVIPQKYATNQLDLKSIINYLQNAPIEFNKDNESLPLYIPMPDGKYELFDVVYSPVMMPKLAEKYPNIRSYKGFSRENKGTNIRFKIGPRGFYASIASKKGNIYIDPFGKDVTDYCISYFTKDYVVDISNVNLTCGTKDDPSLLLKPYNPVRDTDISFREDVVCDTLHQLNYTLAIACTGEWGARRGSVEKALDDINTSVNRINQIYENEVGIHFILHEKNDQLIWLDGETDPFNNPREGIKLLGQVHQVIYNTIGNNFDIGHVYTVRCFDVGGVANLGVVCSNGGKGRGVTCHSEWQDLNYIATNTTCHEMGHQFSAQHTFNYCDGDNESSYGYEPGGGNSIMAYCGLCEEGNNVDYPCLETFHAFSIEQIKTFSREYNGKNCADFISKSNTDPIASVDYENGFSIPIETPFVLEGNAYDCENDNLTYSWEQMNTGPQTPPGNPVENSPIFNTREPKDTPVRYLPDQYSVLYNEYNNSEVYPTYSRDLDFRFLVRDNHSKAGGSDWVDIKFYADGTAGPFEVTYPNSSETHHIGDSINVTWNVANTDNENVNCQSVNVLLSTDKGFTFPYVLKHATPNDGSTTVFIPDLGADVDENSLSARIKVEANDNIFYQVSKKNFRISDRKDTTFVFDISNSNRKMCLPLDYGFNITTRGTNGYQDDIRFEITGLPEGVEYEIVPQTIKTGETAKIEFDFDNSNANGHYEPKVLGISSNGDTIKRFMSWDFYSNDYSKTNILYPVPGNSGIGQNVSFKWNKPQGANYVNFYLSKNPGFPKDETISELEIYDTIFSPDVILDYSTLYYWKLEYKNGCGLIQVDTIYTFATKASDCKIIESEDDPVLIRSSEPALMGIEFPEDVEVTDVNVYFKGKHTRFKEISASLISPSDTVILFNNRGFNYQGSFDLGFDDQAGDYIKQPPKGLFKPDEPLSKFNGKNAKGKWYLQIVDNQSQKSGKLNSFELYICSDAVLNNPYIENNNVFKTAMNKAWAISQENLLIKDNNNTAEELEFTLVKLPKICDIYLKDKKLDVGDSFTQDDINNSRVKIYYHGNDVIHDQFDFTVVDGEGGWIDVTTFNFVSDDKVNIQEVISQFIDVYPNPTSNLVNVSVDIPGNYQLKIYDIKGETILREELSGQSVKSLDLSKLNTGFYFINIFNENYNYTGKLVKE